MMAKPKQTNDDKNSAVISHNRRARFEYELLDEVECGIVLKGSEVKSLRDGKCSLEEAWARVDDSGELWLMQCDIALYPQANIMNHEPRRPRKLLLHRREIEKFAAQAMHKGLTLIPLSMYFSSGRVKVKLAIGKGRQLHDKRDKLKQDDARREIDRAMKTH